MTQTDMTRPTQALQRQDRIDSSINRAVAGSINLSSRGGLQISSMAEAMEFAKLMSLADAAVPKHLRGNVGACLAVAIQGFEWSISPFAIANKSYVVSDRLCYESSIYHAVVTRRAPIKGRLRSKYAGEGESRTCSIWAEVLESDGGGVAEYTSPLFGRIQPKNSPLWKNDPDQQLFYYSVRAFARRHFPDVMMGVYTADELIDSIPRGGSRGAAALNEMVGKPAEPAEPTWVPGPQPGETVDADYTVTEDAPQAQTPATVPAVPETVEGWAHQDQPTPDPASQPEPAQAQEDPVTAAKRAAWNAFKAAHPELEPKDKRFARSEAWLALVADLLEKPEALATVADWARVLAAVKAPQAAQPAEDGPPAAKRGRPRKDAAPAGPDLSTWEKALEAIEVAGADSGLTPSDLAARVNLWLLAAGAKGAEETKTSPKGRAYLLAAIAEKRLLADGRIV